MPIKSKPVKLSFIPGQLRRLLDFGKEHRLQSMNGNLQPGFISRNIIEFMLDTRLDEDVQKYLDEHGGTFMDLIVRALKWYISK